MSDSNNPSVDQQNDGNEPETGAESDKPDGAMPDPDINGEPDQVT